MNTTKVNVSNYAQTLYTYKPVKEGAHFIGWEGINGVNHTEMGHISLKRHWQIYYYL